MSETIGWRYWLTERVTSCIRRQWTRARSVSWRLSKPDGRAYEPRSGRGTDGPPVLVRNLWTGMSAMTVSLPTVVFAIPSTVPSPLMMQLDPRPGHAWAGELLDQLAATTLNPYGITARSGNDRPNQSASFGPYHPTE